MTQSSPPLKVSILVMTYNHANFIKQAIDSVLMQQVNFGSALKERIKMIKQNRIQKKVGI
jgi:glycosyltransferase involved in cell wall biosynthesis